MALLERACPPSEGRRGRPTLSLKRNATAPDNSARLGSDELLEHSGNPTDLQRFEARLWADRNAWSIRQHALGLAGDKRLSKSDAARALAAAIKTLPRSEGNALAKYRRDGAE